MKFKNIEDFTEQDCLNFLANDADNKMAENVRNRLLQIRAERQANIKKAEFEKSQKILELERKMHWIDIEQFNENRKFKSHKIGIILSAFWILICLFMLGCSNYYANTEHYMYSNHSYEQASYTSGLESVLLKMDFIRPPYSYYYYNEENFTPGFYEYDLRESGVAVPLMFGGFGLILLLMFSIAHSPIIKQIYNIENKDKKEKFRAIENKEGKKGICHISAMRLTKMLPMEYDTVFLITPTSYVCKRGGKYGLYNTDVKKMVLPVMYDEIVSFDNDCVVFRKESDIHPFSYKGYRIID